ncbi:hypothetical protein AHAS_Ahas01G0097700 [Arachis hypogaea]
MGARTIATDGKERARAEEVKPSLSPSPMESPLRLVSVAAELRLPPFLSPLSLAVSAVILTARCNHVSGSRPKHVQKQLVFPSLWLVRVTAEAFRVADAPAKTNGTYVFNLEGFILKLCQLAQEVGKDERALHLCSVGLQALSYMVLLLALVLPLLLEIA